MQKIILADFHRLQQQADVQRAAFNALLDVIGVAAINAVRHVRVLGAKRRQNAGKMAGAVVLAAADGNFAGQHCLLL